MDKRTAQCRRVEPLPACLYWDEFRRKYFVCFKAVPQGIFDL